MKKRGGGGSPNHLKAITTHGKSYTPEYKIWIAMKSRCKNEKSPSYKYYGGKGIGFCKRWEKFENFFNDMGKKPTSKHSIERKDSTKGYNKTNCCWATPKEQAINTRQSKKWVIFGIIFDSSRDAAKFFGVSNTSIRQWAKGATTRGKFYAPKNGCFSILKYGEK